jgi:hypothetical protein
LTHEEKKEEEKEGEVSTVAKEDIVHSFLD